MDYDDQHYSEINPDTLDRQDAAEVMLTVWAALRPCREITSRRITRDTNPWIRWARPKRWNPDCGFEVFAPGKYFGKTKFATVAFNIVGNDYEIFIQRRFHDVVLVFSTCDDGPILAPRARLAAATSKMLELTKSFDRWSRDQVLAQHFRSEWIGTSLSTILKAIVASKFLKNEWPSGSWKQLTQEIAKAVLSRPNEDIRTRAHVLTERKGYGRTTAVSLVFLKTVLYLLLSVFVATSLTYLVFNWLQSNSLFEYLHAQWAVSWHAITQLLSPSEIDGFRSWLEQLLALPLAILIIAILAAVPFMAIVIALRYGAALTRFFVSWPKLGKRVHQR